MKSLAALAGCIAVILLLPARVQGQDDQYYRIYGLIQEADGLGAAGQSASALAKYVEAQSALQQLQKLYPDWQIEMVKYRLGYLAERIGGATAPAPAVKAPPVKAPAIPAVRTPPPEADAENQLSDLQGQVRQLQGEKLLLEAKLREALAAQPATIDPRELAKAVDQVRSLQKENELLKVNLSDQRARPAPEADAKTVEQMKRDLADANGRAAVVAVERQALQSKLDNLIAASWNATNIAATRKALDDANRRLAEQSDRAAKLAQDKETLQNRVKTLTADADAVAALRAENEVLKKQAARFKSAAPSGSDEDTRSLSEARAQIAALQSEKNVLHLEKTVLENRLKLLSASPASAAAAPLPPAPVAEVARVKQLERERDDLRKNLTAAQRELSKKRGPAADSRVQELTGEIEVLRTRLSVLETQRAPYSPEELALMRSPEPRPQDGRAGKKSVQELPAGAAVLVAEAQRDFAARRFDQAEEKYRQVLRQDEKNIYTLANLAAIELELNHLDDANTHIQRAIAAAPDDAYSFSILGYLRYRQQKYDEALDALSRAAKLDPHNAEIQNYLGLTLVQKGMRGAAEAAFRQAVQIDPNYASPHNNLAVFYLSQKPPLTALARWHYDRARAAGQPRNAELEKMLDPGN